MKNKEGSERKSYEEVLGGKKEKEAKILWNNGRVRYSSKKIA